MILAIDTSGQNLGLALLSEGDIINSILLKPGLRHGEIIQEEVDRFLDNSKVKFGDVGGMAVTLGPGSFTGLRIGMAAVKGYAYSLNIPISGISTLFAGSHYFSNIDQKVVVIVDARRDEFYFAKFDCSGDEPARLTDDTAGNLNQLQKSINDDTILFGPSHLAEQFVALDGQSRYHISDDFNLAEPTARWGERNIKSSDLLDLETATPVYVRAGF